MDDEKKVDAETTSTETAGTSSENEEHVDYKALFEEEKSRRVKAESVIQRHSKPKDEDGSAVETSSFDPETIRSVIREEVDGLRSSLASQFREKETSDAISKRSSDAHEAALIRYHYDNSIRQTGDLELDIENASALANKKRVQSTIEELKASNVSKETRSQGSGAGRKPNTEPSEETLPTLTPADQKILTSLREQYVVSNAAAKRIMSGETLDSLLASGAVKLRK